MVVLGDVLDVRGLVSKTSLCHKSLPIVLNILSEVTVTVVLVFQMREQRRSVGCCGQGASSGLTLRCLATADRTECQGMPFDTLDQEPCLYLGTSS